MDLGFPFPRCPFATLFVEPKPTLDCRLERMWTKDSPLREVAIALPTRLANKTHVILGSELLKYLFNCCVISCAFLTSRDSQMDHEPNTFAGPHGRIPTISLRQKRRVHERIPAGVGLYQLIERIRMLVKQVACGCILSGTQP